ncbi:hypothetical protein D3C85_854470 [compost metagenome]
MLLFAPGAPLPAVTITPGNLPATASFIDCTGKAATLPISRVEIALVVLRLVVLP